MADWNIVAPLCCSRGRLPRPKGVHPFWCGGGAGENASGDPREQGNSGSLEKSSSHRPSGRRGAGAAVVTRLRGTINSSASCGLSGLNPLQEGLHIGVVEDEGAQQVA